MPFLPCAWSRAPVCRFHKWRILRRPSSRPLAVARPSQSARYVSRGCVTYFTLGKRRREASALGLVAPGAGLPPGAGGHHGSEGYSISSSHHKENARTSAKIALSEHTCP